METFREKGTQLWSGNIRTRLDHLYLKKIGQAPDKIGQDNIGNKTGSSTPRFQERDSLLSRRIRRREGRGS